MNFGNFINAKCTQNIFPQWFALLHFFFPLGIFPPLLADLYILSRILKGHAAAFWKGDSFHLEDDLFSLQRTFALLEAQTESLPQAIFQFGVLLSEPSKDQVGLITLSMAISVASIVLQVLQLRTLSLKEAYPSVFVLIQDLSNGTFVSGINKIRNNSSSILNLSNIFIDRKKMDLVSDLIDLRPNLHTIILNINVLTYTPEFLADWLFRLNGLRLKFLVAQKVEDIQQAFDKLDSNQNGTISTEELGEFCETGAVEFWKYKYGPEYQMNIKAILGFLKNEAVEIPATCYSIFQVALSDRFPEGIRMNAEKILETFGQRINVENILQFVTNYDPKQVWTGNLVAINGSNIDRIESQTIDATSVNHLHLPSLVKLDLKKSNLKQIGTICTAQLPKLEIFDISDCRGLVASTCEFPDMFARLQTLNLSKSNWENCRSLFAAKLSSLKTLNLSYCKSLKSDDVEEIGLSSLESLNLSESNWKNCLSLFAAELSSLKTLNLSHCKSLKSDDVEEIGLSSLSTSF